MYTHVHTLVCIDNDLFIGKYEIISDLYIYICISIYI